MTRREWQIAVPILVGLLLCVAGFMHGVQIESSLDGATAGSTLWLLLGWG
ncbi:hypothetical protein [Ramlibacter sp. WS9]|nr:hypothetical protein [Ramlibacter sp. WS9]